MGWASCLPRFGWASCPLHRDFWFLANQVAYRVTHPSDAASDAFLQLKPAQSDISVQSLHLISVTRLCDRNHLYSNARTVPLGGICGLVMIAPTEGDRPPPTPAANREWLLNLNSVPLPFRHCPQIFYRKYRMQRAIAFPVSASPRAAC